MNESSSQFVFPVELSPEETARLREKQAMDQKQLKKDQALEDLGILYDEKYPDRKNDENYERIKKEWVAEEFENVLSDEYFSQDKEKALFDHVTGFRVRSELFVAMDKELKKLFGVKSGEVLTNEEWVLRLKDKKFNFDDIDLSVLAADISFLSLANEAGHAVGDEYLKYISSIVRKYLNASRHGGDEITALIREPEMDYARRLNKMREEIKASEKVANLGDYDLRPNLDFGVAHITEGLRIFRQLLETPEGRERMKVENPLSEFQNVWLEIADKRSFIEKGKERVTLLMDKFSEDYESYGEVIAFLKKGGYNISEGDLENLVTETDCENKAEVEKAVESFIYGEEKKKIEELKGYNRIKAELICTMEGI